ncbi:hypothetical protein K8R66_01700 [bacterium]|nr:hypothetical protein [bacterium]
MTNGKGINSLLSTALLVSIVICAVVVLGIYMNDRWKVMRDIRRKGDIKQVDKIVELYLLNYGKLPENQSDNEWDSSYDPQTKNKTLFKSLQDLNLISSIFDPKNDEVYNYRYHKFKAYEYGCNRSFAIFQVTGFEDEVDDHGKGECPDRDFAAEVPNGYTIQWFE